MVMSKNEDPDLFRVMICTDNHVGYLEKDPVRGMDSFASFEEIMGKAKTNNCDFVLHGGDLYHENKPSRKTIYNTMNIFRKTVMGDDPVQFQIVSDQEKNFNTSHFKHVNYEDPSYSIAMPVFIIHGNHDDPSRDGAGNGEEALSALDLLSVSNYVNYFGKSDHVDEIQVNPIMLRKGKTWVAIYGLGNMRDERLNRMWNQKKVKFLRHPSKIDENTGEEIVFFNIFVVHQNRDSGRGKKNCVHESMIPEWMDLVLWGHEHECIPSAIPSVIGDFYIYQPGSSVATSLTEGEAKRKEMGILEIKKKDERPEFRIVQEPINNVRPFIFGEVILADHADILDPNDPKIENKLSDFLKEKVYQLIEQAREEREESKEVENRRRSKDRNNKNTSSNMKYSPLFGIEKENQVLVRLKVEYTGGYQTINNQRFGSQFVGEVANPSNILNFHKRRQTNLMNDGDDDKKSKKKDKENRAYQGLYGDEYNNIGDVPQTSIDDLVRDNLNNATTKLTLLEENEMCDALEDFVAKGSTSAIGDYVEACVEKTKKKLKRNSKLDGPDDIKESIAQANKRKNKDARVTKDDDDDDDNDDDDDDDVEEEEEEKAPARGKKRAAVDIDEDDDEQYKRSTKKPLGGRKTTSRGKKKALSSDDEDAISSEVSEEEYEPRAKKSAKSTSASTGRRVTSARAASRKVTYVDSDSEDIQEIEDSDDDISSEEEAPKKTARGRGGKASKTSTTTKAKKATGSLTQSRGRATASKPGLFNRSRNSTQRTQKSQGDLHEFLDL